MGIRPCAFESVGVWEYDHVHFESVGAQKCESVGAWECDHVHFESLGAWECDHVHVVRFFSLQSASAVSGLRDYPLPTEPPQLH